MGDPEVVSARQVLDELVGPDLARRAAARSIRPKAMLHPIEPWNGNTSWHPTMTSQSPQAAGHFESYLDKTLLDRRNYVAVDERCGYRALT